MVTVVDQVNDAGPMVASSAVCADRLAVIVPVYNEERTVAELLRRLEVQPCVSQIIIVDDGSTDRTWEDLAPWRARASVNTAATVSDVDSLSVIVVQHDKNRGKGRAIRTGLEHVSCSHVIIQDADLEYDPSDINTLWEKMISGTTDVVYGSRYLKKSQLQKGRLILQSGVRLLNLTTRLLYGVCLTDQATCYKMFRTADLRRMNLQCERFEFCAEVTAKACLLGLRNKEVAIRYAPRTELEGKKLSVCDGYAAFSSLVGAWRHRRSLQMPRPRRWQASIVIALFIAVSLSGGWRYFSIDRRDRMKVSTEARRSVTRQLGRLGHKESIVTAFEFRNESTSTWNLLTSRTSCGCSKLVLSESSVSPGSTLHGQLTIVTPSLAGPFSVTAVISACLGQELEVNSSGEVIPPFLASPAKLTVSSDQPQQFRCPVLTPGTEIALISFPSWCIVSLDRDRAEEILGTVSIEPGSQPANARTGYIVLTDQRGFRQSVEVSTDGASWFTTYPTVLHFGTVEVGSTQSRTLSIIAASDIDGSAGPQLLTHEPQLRVELSKCTAGATVATVYLDADAQGILSTMLTISFGKNTLEVPVSARVEARRVARQQ